MQQLNTNAANLNSSFKDLGRIVSGIVIAQLFYRAVHAITDATNSVIEFSLQMEVAEASFTRMLESSQRATGFIEVMKDFAAVTEYNVDETLDFSRRLQAMGVEATQTKGVMTILTDEVAILGGGSQKLDRLVYAIGQIKNSSKLAQPEIRQLTEAGVNAVKYLKEGFGLTAKEAQNVGKLGISGADAVKVILAGMQADSRGMAAVIAETTHGMINTIKDDILLVSQEATEGAFRMAHNVIRNLRDFLETTRNALRTGGIGQILNNIFSPEIANAIRYITGSLRYLFLALGTIKEAFGPALTQIIRNFVLVLAAVLPPITGFILLIAQLIKVTMQYVAPVRWLVEALGALFIVFAIARAFEFLYAVLRLGTLFAFVAEMVLMLAAALKALAVVLYTNKIYSLLLAIAASVVSLGAYFGWFNNIIAKTIQLFGTLTGVDVSNILQPVANPELAGWMEEFNKQLDLTGDGLDDTADAADAAAKAVKDTFVASFDELYNIPDTLDKVTKSMTPDLSKFKIPTLPDAPFKDLFKDPIPLKFDWGAAPWWLLSLLAFVPRIIKWWKNRPKKPGSGEGGGSTSTAEEVAKLISQPAVVPVPAPTPKAKRARDPATGRFTRAVQTIVAEAAAMMGTLKGIVSEQLPVFVTLAGVATVIIAARALLIALAALPMIIEVIAVLVPIPAAAALAALAALPAIWYVATQLAPVPSTALEESMVDVPKSVTIPVTASVTEESSKSIIEWLESIPGIVTEHVPVLATSFQIVGNVLNAIMATEFAKMGVTVVNFLLSVPRMVTEAIPTLVTSFTSLWNAAGIAVDVVLVSMALRVTTFLSSIPTTVASYVTIISNAFKLVYLAANLATNGVLGDMLAAVGQFLVDLPANVVKGIPEVALSFVKLALSLNSIVTKMFTKMGEEAIAWLVGIPKWVNEHKESILTALELLFVAIVAVIVASLLSVPAAIASAIAGIVLVLSNAFKIDFVDAAKEAFNSLPGKLEDVKTALMSTADSVASAVGNVFSNAFNGIKTAYNNLTKEFKAPSVQFAGGSASGFSINVPGAASGGIVDRNQLINVGEGNRKETIMPLSAEGLRPFAQALMGELGLNTFGGSGARQNNLQPLYVGTLIADDRSLKELERKMQVIRMSENQRKGVV
jgi:tape measure domain-containing protein